MRDERLEVLLTQEQISRRVGELSADISRDYKNKNLLLLCVLKGAVFFLADLARALTVEADIGFVTASSYDGEQSVEEVDISPILRADIASKDVLVVEDVLDTGLTYRTLALRLMACEPASLKLCALLDKPSERRQEPVNPDYAGFTIPDEFVVGYGLDYREKYRGLKDICVLVT